MDNGEYELQRNFCYRILIFHSPFLTVLSVPIIINESFLFLEFGETNIDSIFILSSPITVATWATIAGLLS